MMTTRWLSMLAAGAAFLALPVRPVLAVNPQDIAIIGNLQAETDFVQPGPTRDRLLLSELELAYQGYLSPTARADVFIALHPAEGGEHGFEIEPEEAYVTLLELPGQTSLRLGKLKPSFGKLNPFHPEQWFTVDRPAVLAAFLGEEGLEDLGAEVSVRLPNPWDAFLQLNAAILNSGSDIATPGAGDIGKAGSFRFSGSVDVGEDAYVEAGVSGLGGPAPAGVGGGANLAGGLDLTGRWRPDHTTSFTLTAEALGLRQWLPAGQTASPTGFYALADYQFLSQHDAGLRLDRAGSLDPASAPTWATSAFYTYAPWEYNRYRLQVTQGLPFEGGQAGDTRVLGQVIFSLGPHKHPVQF